MSFIDDIANSDVAYTEDSGKNKYPTLWFHNGKKDRGTPGTFYAKAKDFDHSLPGTGWIEEERYPGEDGYSAEILLIAPIAWRKTPYIDQDDKEVYLPEWIPGARFKTQMIGFIQGRNTPIIFSYKGMVGQAINGKEGILKRWQDIAIRPAEKKAGKRLAPWAFYIPLRSKLNDDGSVVYEKSKKGSIYTPITLAKENPDLNKLWIGGELYRYGADILEENREWLKQQLANQSEPLKLEEETIPDPRAQDYASQFQGAKKSARLHNYPTAPATDAPDDLNVPF